MPIPRVLSTATFAAIISLALIKIFCELAMADTRPPMPVPAINAPARAVGTYRITDATSDLTENGVSLCVPHRESGRTRPADPMCGKNVWVVRNDTQLALLEAKSGVNDRTDVNSVLLSGWMIHRKCKSQLGYEHALAGGALSTDFCRGFLEATSSDSNVDSFEFSSSVPTLSALPEETNVIEGAFMVGFLTAFDGSATIQLPRGEASPRSIDVTVTITSMVLLFFPSIHHTHYTLTYVSN